MEEKLKLISGNEIANKISEKLKSEFSKLKNIPRLDILLLGDSLESAKYVELKEKKGRELGVNVVVQRLDIQTSSNEIISLINELNNDSSVNGIMVQLPLPRGFETLSILNRIDPIKDVDGLTSTNLGKVFANDRNSFLSATAKAVDTIFSDCNIDLAYKDVVVIGTSIEVGLPIAANLLNKKATVQLCNINTKDLEDKTLKADIVISATGSPKLITSKNIKKGAIVIDVGFTLQDSKVYGDVDYDDVKGMGITLSPVPGGVGPVTVVSLFANVLHAYKNQNE